VKPFNCKRVQDLLKQSVVVPLNGRERAAVRGAGPVLGNGGHVLRRAVPLVLAEKVLRCTREIMIERGNVVLTDPELREGRPIGRSQVRCVDTNQKLSHLILADNSRFFPDRHLPAGTRRPCGP